MKSQNGRSSMLCSEILNLHLRFKAGRERELSANLEEIWSSGALFLTDVRVPCCASLTFSAGGHQFRGTIASRKFFKGLGYFIEVQLAPSSRWSEQKYQPKHFFNPLMMLADRIFEATPHPPVSPPEGLLPPVTFDVPLGFKARRHAV